MQKEKQRDLLWREISDMGAFAIDWYLWYPLLQAVPRLVCHLPNFLPKQKLRKTLAEIIISFTCFLLLSTCTQTMGTSWDLCPAHCRHSTWVSLSPKLLSTALTSELIYQGSVKESTISPCPPPPLLIWSFLSGKGVYPTQFYVAGWIQIICLYYVYVGRKEICSARKSYTSICHARKSHISNPLGDIIQWLWADLNVLFRYLSLPKKLMQKNQEATSRWSMLRMPNIKTTSYLM